MVYRKAKIFHTFFPSSSFRVHSVTMDHSWAIRNGAVAAFGDEIRIISCWVHVLRKCKENVGKLVHKDYIKNITAHVSAISVTVISMHSGME